jgi:hypothetical protein
MEELFRDHLGGSELLVNNTKWTSFRVIRNRRLSAGSVVLLGDSAHTAHPSVGSGTKLAMEDAIALADSLCTGETVPGALAAYERERRPAIERTQRLGEPSMRWWETYRTRIHFDLGQLGFHYLTRTTALGYAGIRRRDPDAVARLERWFAASRQSSGSPPSRPSPSRPPPPHAAAAGFTLGPAVLPTRLVTILPAGLTPSRLAELTRRSGLIVLDPAADRASWRDAAVQARRHGTPAALTAGLNAGTAAESAAAADLAAAAQVPFLYVELDRPCPDSIAWTQTLVSSAEQGALFGVTAGLRVPRAPLRTAAGERFAAWCGELADTGVVALLLMCAEDDWEQLLDYADLVRARTRIPVCVSAPPAWTMPEAGFTEADIWSSRLHTALLSGRADLIARDLRS